MADSISNQGTLGAANEAVALGLAGFGGVAIQIQGTFSGTITFEATVQGQDFTAFRMTPVGSTTAVTTATTTGIWAGSTVGLLVVRARMSAYTSGQATILLRADVASPGGSSSGGGVGSNVNVIEVGGASLALGEATMAASVPVVIASNQTPVHVIVDSGGGSNASVGVVGAAAPASATEVGFVDGSSGELRAFSSENIDGDTGAGTVPVTGFAPLLPASGGPVWGGTATNPLQVGDAGGSLTVDGTVAVSGTVAISAVSLPLPTGAATSAKQDTEIASLASIDTKTLAAGQAVMAVSSPVVIASNQTAVPVSAASLPLPTGAATLAEQQTQTASLSVLDDWDESDRAKVNVIVGQAGIAAGTGVDGVTVPRVTLATNVALPAGTNNIGDVDVLSSALPTGASTLAEQQTQTTALGTILTSTNFAAAFGTAGTADTQVLSVQGIASMTPVQVSQATASNLNAQAVGDVAHDSADAGNPVKVGAKAVSAEPTAVTANDRVNLIADLVGKLIVLPYANPENFVSGAITSAMTGTTSTSLIAAPAAGLRNYITQITVSNAHATVGTDIVIQDGSGGTTLYTLPAAALYGGATVTFPTPLRQPTTATAIFVANVTTGASTKASASGYKGV